MTAPGGPSITVVVPVLNGSGWISRCVEHVVAALRAAELQDAEVVVVDDGSTDGTADEARAAMAGVRDIPLRVLGGPNRGRFLARRRGLEAAHHPYVLLIDTRVFLDRTALAFVAPKLADPSTAVWTSHVTAATDGNHLAGFWQAIEHVAWRRYFARPRTTAFGPAEFDWYPKGTTALLAPRQLLLDALDAYVPTVEDWRKVNDDTAVLRWVAERTPINISPRYASTYNARTTLGGFLRHAEHRGTVLVDGYLRPGTRFHRPLQVVLALTPAGLWLLLRHPAKAAALAVAGSATTAVGAVALGARRQDAAVLGAYAVPFGVVYLGGIWRGALLRLRAVSGGAASGQR